MTSPTPSGSSVAVDDFSTNSPGPTKPVKGSRKVGHLLAKALNIELDEPVNYRSDSVTRGESVYSQNSEGVVYVEADPTVAEWFTQFCPTAKGAWAYFMSFFPFLTWIGRYNLKWATGDLIAGITVGCVVVPQGMAYSKLALLPPEYGLYSSFVGVVIYWFFATSKDITIGPVAVMSVLVGNIVADFPEVERPHVASALALICGCIVFALGMFRLGFIVDYIPLTAIAAFMTGSALNIATGQIPAMLGTKSFFNTREATYLVFINMLKNLGNCKIDAAMGLTALLMLYIIRWVFTKFLVRKFPQHQKAWFFISTLRTAFVLLLYTMVSWLVNRHRRDDPLFAILKTVPRGFQHMGVPKVEADMISAFAGQLPAAVIVLLIEHIAISKSFGRINNYTINPSQELVAIGITNIFGPFFGAYPATGSFSRTAIKSKSGVRTPFAGVITGVIVLLSIYLLTAVFFYIPDATLSAVIIHAVLDLITPPNTVYKFWRVSPIETVIFFAGVIVTIFSSIENGIYVTVAVSGVLLLFRIAKARGHFLGRIQVHSLPADALLPATNNISDATLISNLPPTASNPTLTTPYGTVTTKRSPVKPPRSVFLPLDRDDGHNPSVQIATPHPGIFVYRFSEGFLYPNAAHYTEHLVEHIFKSTRPTSESSFASPGDRAWNDLTPSGKSPADVDHTLPTLKAIVLDFSTVNNVDITSVQNLLDVQNQLDRHASPTAVEWHFASVNNRWTKRALAGAGFGCPRSWKSGTDDKKPLFSVAEIAGEVVNEEVQVFEKGSDDLEASRGLTGGGIVSGAGTARRVVPVSGVGRPFFHVDLEGAVENAVRYAEDNE